MASTALSCIFNDAGKQVVYTCPADSQVYSILSNSGTAGASFNFYKRADGVDRQLKDLGLVYFTGGQNLIVEPLVIPSHLEVTLGGEDIRQQLYFPSSMVGAIAKGTNEGCGSCVTGEGKAVQLSAFSPGTTYTANVDVSAVTDFTPGSFVQVHKWTQEPFCPPTGENEWQGRVWVADLPTAGGSFNISLNSGDWGFSFSMQNQNTDNNYIGFTDFYDTLCGTWNQETKTFVASGFGNP